MITKTKQKLGVLIILAMLMQVAVFNLPVTQAVSPGAIVINEIAWGGTQDNWRDEWVELFNTTDQTIDLTGWYIEDNSRVYEIESGEIAPFGYFVLADKEESFSNFLADAIMTLSLLDGGEKLTLFNNLGTVMDTVNSTGGSWYAGDGSTKATMERIDPYNLNDTPDNWGTATSGNGVLGRYGTPVLGTPGSINSVFDGDGAKVSILPENLAVESGNVTFTVVIDDVEDFYAYGFELNYDSNILQFVSAEELSFLQSDGEQTAFFSALENGAEGNLLVGSARLVNPIQGISGNGELFDLTFSVVGGNDEETIVSFFGNNFVSDSVGDVPVAFNNANLLIGESTVSNPQNLEISEGEERFTLQINWGAPEGGADKYIINRKAITGDYVKIGETTENYFVDNDDLELGGNIIPTLDYSYEVIAVKNGMQSHPIEISGADNRGLMSDLDRNDRVDGRDLELLARAYGSSWTDAHYLPLADTNYDGIIDGSDLIDLGINFGLTY